MAAPAYIPPDDYSMLIRANETLSDPTLDDAGRSSALMSLSGLYPQSVASGAPEQNMTPIAGNPQQAQQAPQPEEHIVVPNNLGQQSADLGKQIMGNIAASAPQTNPEAAPKTGVKAVFADSATAAPSAAAASGPRAVTVGTNTYQPSVMTTQTETGGKLSPDAQDEITRADDALRDAQVDAAKVKLDADAALDAKKAELAGQIAARDKLNAERVAFRNEDLARRQKRLEDVIKENELQDQIKPTPMGERWANAIAVALGTLSSAITGQPNTAWDVVRKKMDDELAQQKEASRLRDKNLANQNDLYNIALQHADSEHEADLLARAAMQQQAAATLDKFAAAALPPQQKQQLEVMRAQNQSDSIRTQNQLRAENEQKTIINETKHFDPKRTVVIDPRDAAIKSLEKDKKIRDLTGSDSELDVPGYGSAVNKTAADEARQLIDARNSVISKIAELRQIRKEKGPRVVAGGGKVLQELAANDVARIIAGGAKTTDTDVESGKKIVPNPEDFIAPNFEEKLDTMEATVQKQFNRQMQTRIRGWTAPK